MILLLVILINLTPVQNFLVQKATNTLSQKLKTKVAISHIRVDFLNHIVIEGLYVADHANDTLLYAGEAQVRITDWFFLRKGIPVLHYIGLHHTKAHLYRTASSGEWNYQFIADAFQDTSKSTNKQNNFEIDLRKVDLQDVHFHMDDAWVGDDMDYDIGAFELSANNIDFKKKIIDVSNIHIEGAAVAYIDYVGGRPAWMQQHKTEAIDTTPFNPDHWLVKVKQLSLENSVFNLKMSDKTPVPGEFDPDHIYVKNINIDANNIAIKDDTIHGFVNNFTAKDRCGIEIKKMTAKVTVSPNASVCDNLYLETNNSKLHHYYAMRYKRFPDFEDYIDKVVMEGNLDDAQVDSRDIAYFAPQLRSLPASILKVSGSARGTVADLSARNMHITDGNTVLRGNIRMTGLPDIYKTYINYQQGEILTTGAGILRYAPSLKGNPNLALERLSYIYFKGDYTGYIENFAVNGVLNTNLGTITSNVKMDVPGFMGNNAVYSGTVSTDHFNLGALLRQPDLGSITFKSGVNGNAFDPQHAALKIDATISSLDYKGYNYQNILAQGTLARKEFKGFAQVDDSNLALAFNGDLNFSQKEISVNAKANLLKSNFNALHLTKDTIIADADFDLNCTGSSIDNFLGYAKLYNIDLKRNQHRLALDSIYVNSTDEDGKRTLTIQSNDILATIKGDYQLTKLPYSVQYYLSRYLPNYIKIPSKAAPAQNLTFSVKTQSVDSLLAVATSNMRGFDNSVFSGALNTTQQKLTLQAKVPAGIVGNFRMSNINITGDGNFDVLALNATADNVTVKDSILSGSLSLTTTIGNDSVNFNVSTATPDAHTSVTLNGQAYAHKDSIFCYLKPSEFFLNQNHWTVSGGSKIAYSDKYLFIKGLVLQSGLQKISVNTQYDLNNQSLTVNTESLDISQLGTLFGLAGYQPDGRIDGSVQINHLFRKDLFVTTKIKATNVMLGPDTVGNINLLGYYDASRKLVSLDPQTGIYNGNSSLIVSGVISFDSTSSEQLNGNIQFNNARTVWFSTFVAGFMSHLGGTLNGNIAIAGNSDAPEIQGMVGLSDGSMHIDFLGTNYTIPFANVTFDSKRIDVGTVTIFDSYQNPATLTGYFSHQHFKDMQMHLRITSPKLEIFNLHDYENQYFYGKLIAGFDPLTIRGPFNNISLDISHGVPAGRSRIYIPIQSSSSIGSYSYVSFKSYGHEQEKTKRRSHDRFNINILANMNTLAEMVLVLDPSTGDAITARGTGSLRLEIPSDNDIRMYGTYNIEQGDYSFTFKQLLSLRRKFILNSDSKIDFNGPFSQTRMDVNATYTAHTRLYDLLSDQEKQSAGIPPSELSDAKIPQDVNVLLNMRGSLDDPKLSFNIKLPETRSIGTYAYTKLERIDQDDRQLFDQVAAILLIGNFIPPEGIGNTTAVNGAINNFSQILSTTASSQLTNIVNKILGDKNLSVDLKYSSYNLSDPSLGPTGSNISRNQLSLGVRKNYFHDRLAVEVGSVSDWGHPGSSSSTSNFNIAGDFRIQYLLSEMSGLRLNGFRTSDYDVTLDRDITRSGVGISWRKSFDGFAEFFHGNRYALRKKKQQEEKEDQLIKQIAPAQTDTVKKDLGTE